MRKYYRISFLFIIHFHHVFVIVIKYNHWKNYFKVTFFIYFSFINLSEKKIGTWKSELNFFFQCLKIWVRQSFKKKKTTNNLKTKGFKKNSKISFRTYHHHHSSSWTQRDYWGPHRPPFPPLGGRSCPGPRNQRTNHSEERR